MKKKTLGLSILECPCSLSSSESCADCSPTASKENSCVESETLNVDTEKNDQTSSVIDTKFLIASPRALHKEKSALDSDNEESTPLIGSIDNISNGHSNNNNSAMTHDEINSLFNNATKDGGDRHSSVSDNSDLFVFEEELFSNKSNSIITINSASDTSSNPNVNMVSEGVHRKQSKDNDSKAHHQPRKKNVLSSIQSILNENKSLDAKSKSFPALKHNNNTPSSNERKKERNSQKDSKKDSRKRKDSNNKKKQKQRDLSKSKNKYDSTEDVSHKHAGGILPLPQGCQEQMQLEQRHLKESSPQTKQVHFVISGKFCILFFLLILKTNISDLGMKY